MSTANTISIISAPPVANLGELRRQNSNLLQRDVAGEGTSKPSPGELLGFLTEAAKLGRTLQDFDARETAQGIMDFWIARLLSEAPETAEGTRPFTLEHFDECSAVEHVSEARQLRVEALEAAKRADEILPEAPDEALKRWSASKNYDLSSLHDWMPRCLKPWVLRISGRDSEASVLQRLLLRFIRLKEKSTAAYSVPVAENDTVFEQPQATVLLERLLKVGLVKHQDGSYLLAHESLLTKWNYLVDVIIQRVAFRQLARGWENGGRKPAALLSSGAQLQQAIEYPHLDEMEDAFLKASLRGGVSFRRIVFSVLGLFALVTLSLVIWLTITNSQVSFFMGQKDEVRDHIDKLKKITGWVPVASSNSDEDKLIMEQTALVEVNSILSQQLTATHLSKSYLYSLGDLYEQVHGQHLEWPFKRKQVVGLKPNPALLKTFKEVLESAFAHQRVATTPDTKGMFEIFVDASAVGSLERAQPLVEALEQVGFVHSAGLPLPRSFVPEARAGTAVRYFHAEDEMLAKQMIEVLKKANLKGEIEPEDETTDADQDTPQRFIQIAIAKGALDPSKSVPPKQ